MRYIILITQLSLVASLLSFMFGCSGGSSNSSTKEPVQLSFDIIDTPKAFLSDGRWNMVYELVINNQSNQTINLDSFAVEESGSIIYSANSQSLSQLALENNLQIEANEFTALFLWITLESEQSPTQITNNVEVITTQGTTSQHQYTVNLDMTPLLKVKAPLTGTNWMPLALHNESHHRRSFLMYDDQPRFSQRFAIDWVKVDENGQWFSADSSINENHYAYGQNVYAVANGEIVKVINGYPDNIPGQTADETTPVAGNYVVLELESGESVLYAHLIVDSIIVKEGDLVEAGQVLGRIGNSGNSNAPHLHIHVANIIDLDSQSSLNAIGQPYVLDSFEVVSEAQVLGLVEEQLPINQSIVNFLADY